MNAVRTTGGHLSPYFVTFTDGPCTIASESVLKFLVTSRPYDSVQRRFEQITSELPQIRLRDEDENDKIHEEINLVVEQRVNELATNLPLLSRNREWLRQRLL